LLELKRPVSDDHSSFPFAHGKNQAKKWEIRLWHWHCKELFLNLSICCATTSKRYPKPDQAKIYTGINVMGLAVSITACLLIVFYVRHELSYDKFFPGADRIYKMVLERKYPNHATHYSAIHTLLRKHATGFS